MPSTAALPAVWGILNVTPDSFSDGGRFARLEEALAHGRRLAEEGADVIDVGGESTRPGAEAVPTEVELERVVPVIEGLRRAGLVTRLSVDTRRAEVARAALAAGASIVNDVSAGADPAMFDVVAGADAGLVLMHMQGEPRTMQAEPSYDDVVGEVEAWLHARARSAEAAGVPVERLWIDPGIGFGKTLEHNLALLRALDRLAAARWPVLLGASRKSFIGRVSGEADPGRRLGGSLACALRALEAGVAAVRVHDVAATRQALMVFTRIRGPGVGCSPA